METGVADDVPGSLCLVEPMALAVLRQIRQALVNLNPAQVRAEADRRVRVGLIAASQESLGRADAGAHRADAGRPFDASL